MDEMIYNALNSYFHALELKGYMSYPSMQKLLVLILLRDFVYHDYRGTLSLEDYRSIEKALDCLYGSTCLIPYPDYLKMGKLHLGSMTEMAQRLSNVELIQRMMPYPVEVPTYPNVNPEDYDIVFSDGCDRAQSDVE